MERTAPPRPGSSLQRYLPVIQRCRDMALIQFGSWMTTLFEKVEPALLDFIDKADTNQSQFQFIDAISVVRSRKETVEQRFREEISRGFTEFSRGQPISYPFPLLESQFEDSGEGLALVDDAELDRRLSLQNMIDKTERRCFQQLYALKQRLSMVRGGHKLDDTDIPTGPAHCASAFQIAIGDLDFDINVLLIIHAMFEKFVLRNMETLYEEFNQELIEAGVFPNLKLEVAKQPDAPEPATYTGQKTGSGAEPGSRPAAAAGSRGSGTAAAEPSSPGSADAALGEELFNSIRDLMASRRRQDPRYAHHPDIHPEAATGQPLVETPVLVSALEEIQPRHSDDYLPEVTEGGERPARIEVDNALLEQVRQRLIEEREKLFRGVDPNTIPSADLDTIELVGMLFEHVLNEEELPNIAKALISHLHTPYLKVAILDHRFLIDSRHIARRLLNLMVDAGREWIEEEDLRRGIYYPMQEGVNRVLAEFKEDMGVFEEVYDDLTRSIEELKQKAKVVEARAREAAKGRERLENARIRAHRIVQEHIGDRRFHPAIERFLNHAWLDKMILMLLRDPGIEESLEWREVISVIDDVARVTELKENPAIRQQFRSRLPGLKKRIENGLSSMGDVHQPDLHALFEALTVLGESDGTAPEPAEAPAPAASGRSDQAEVPSEQDRPQQLNAEERAIVEQLGDVTFGTWFELEDDKGVPHRLKLSWFSPVTQKYMFVDKSGIQALVTPIEVLARQMHRGKARILTQPKLPFVDRALEAIQNMLRLGSQ
ncbi:MAG TPA: DUF1631 domain-containing protein [Sedimenticola thiotaurini]|uniref:DUF1631 domain-containing protein n=1 Tax=Sedimenticola thiotaurini TaxID=1543721 RepID=A0A831RHR3_9GAMM|nr:DUF1631 domain-containing protein [Sedimenticola thiotaurini]